MDAQSFENEIRTVQPTAAGFAGSIQLVGVTGEAVVKEDGTAAHNPMILVTPSVSSGPSAPTPSIPQPTPFRSS